MPSAKPAKSVGEPISSPPVVHPSLTLFPRQRLGYGHPLAPRVTMPHITIYWSLFLEIGRNNLLMQRNKDPHAKVPGLAGPFQDSTLPTTISSVFFSPPLSC